MHYVIPELEMRDFFQGMKDAGFNNAGKDISMIETSPEGKDSDLWINTAEKTVLIGSVWELMHVLPFLL